MLFKERKNPVVKGICCNQNMLPIVQFDHRYYAISINKSLLTGAANQPP